ncbi:pyridoxal-phosphate dependent enzyme [Corynebacterium aquatimens]|nr:pyridoxal-phosphate dependent enzyme [Corynebacterium aquatimens]
MCENCIEGPGLLDTVGATPLIRIDDAFQNGHSDPGVRVWGKLESFNPGGSAKDRTARALVQAAVDQGILGPGATVVESSSGNLGVALAREAAIGGWDFHCVVDQRTNTTTLAHIKALGATIHPVTQPDPETGDWLAARRKKVAELIDELGAINLDQYSNRAAFTAHSQGTMKEIVDTLGHAPDYLLVAVSTTGTVGGCLRSIAENGLDTKVIAVDAEGSVLFNGARADRILPGFGAGVVPDLSREVTPDRVVRVGARDCITAARNMAAATGFLPGASGGAVASAVAALLDDLAGQPERGADPVDPVDPVDIVAIFHDDGRAYLDTIYDDDWVEENAP